MTALLSNSLTLRKNVKITEDEFRQLRDFIYRHSGIHIAEKRKYLLENRLGERLKALGLRSFSEYYNYICYDSNRRSELNTLWEKVTTNETSFYRDVPQLKVFQERILPEVLEARRKEGRLELNVWSAGCSSGEEPYTLAIMLLELLGREVLRWKLRITAVDLSQAVIDKAKEGVYDQYAVRTTPPQILSRYFDQDGNTYALKAPVKRLVTFQQMNLNDAAALKRIPRSHIVFCRNVIIYFDMDMKKRVVSSFYDNLVPGGVLMIGHSESLHHVSTAFKPTHHPGTVVYKKD